MSREEIKRLADEQRDLLEEDRALAAQGSAIRKRREEIKDRSQEIKEARYDMFHAACDKLRKETKTIKSYLEGVKVLWNQLPANLTYPRIKQIYWDLPGTKSPQLVKVRGGWHAPVGRPNSENTRYLAVEAEMLIEFSGKDALRGGDYKHPFDTWSRSGKHPIVVHTGTGGYRSPSGNAQNGWYTTIFLEDFPRIWKKLKKVLPKTDDAVGIRLSDLDTFLDLELEDHRIPLQESTSPRRMR